MSPALRMGFELLRPWGIISSVGVHNTEVSPKDHCLQSCIVLTHCRSPGTGTTDLPVSTIEGMADNSIGLVTRRTERICASRWADALYDQYFLELWIC